MIEADALLKEVRGGVGAGCEPRREVQLHLRGNGHLKNTACGSVKHHGVLFCVPSGVSWLGGPFVCFCLDRIAVNYGDYLDT